MLSLRAVNQYYGNQHTLWNIDLDLTPGVCTSVIGLPGMGKTTLINCITGYLPVEERQHDLAGSGRTAARPAECVG